MSYASGRAWSAAGQGLSSIGTLLLQLAEQRRQEQRDEPMRNLQMANAYSQLTGMRAVPDLAGQPFERVNPEALAAATATPYQAPQVQPSPGTRAGGVGLQPEDIMGPSNMQPFGIRAESGAPGGLEVGELAPQQRGPTEPLMEPDPSYVQAPGVSGFQFRTPEAERERMVAQLTPAWEDFINKNPSLGGVSGQSVAELQALGVPPTQLFSSTGSLLRAQRPTRWYPQTEEEMMRYQRALRQMRDDPTKLESDQIDMLSRRIRETQTDLADLIQYRDYYVQNNRISDWHAQRSELITNRWMNEDEFIRAQDVVRSYASKILPSFAAPSGPAQEDPLAGYPGPGNW